MKNAVSIKGTREGLTITLGAGEFTELLTELGEHLKTQGAFFRGGQVALQVGDHVVSEEGLRQLADMLSQYEMVLRTVVASSPVSQMAVHALGLRLLEPTPSEAPAKASERPAGPAPSQASEPNAAPAVAFVRQGTVQDSSKGVMVRHLVRSGQVIRHTGHVVIIGDVNVGAEISAGGDVVIWGRLFGTVHAGALGDDRAIVCTLDLNPLQLRIGNHIARPGEEARPAKRAPEVASVRGDAIVVQPWDAMAL